MGWHRQKRTKVTDTDVSVAKLFFVAYLCIDLDFQSKFNFLCMAQYVLQISVLDKSISVFSVPPPLHYQVCKSWCTSKVKALFDKLRAQILISEGMS